MYITANKESNFQERPSLNNTKNRG